MCAAFSATNSSTMDSIQSIRNSITDATVAFDKCFTETVDELVVSIYVGKTKDNG